MNPFYHFKIWLKSNKNRILLPIARFLRQKYGITANHSTFFSFITGLTASYFLFYNHALFVIFILLSIFFDILDGLLAQLEKKNDWFLDQASDRLVNLAILIKTTVHFNSPFLIYTTIFYLFVSSLHIFKQSNTKKELNFVYITGAFYPAYILKLYMIGNYFLFLGLLITLGMILSQSRKLSQ